MAYRGDLQQYGDEEKVMRKKGCKGRGDFGICWGGINFVSSVVLRSHNEEGYLEENG